MNDRWQRALGGYLRFLGLLATTGLLVVVTGYLPTKAVFGAPAIGGLLAAACLGLAASALGGIPVFVTVGRTGAASTASLLGSLAVRFLTVLGAAAAVALMGLLEPRSFLIWVGVSYLAYLVADVRYALKEQRELEGTVS